MVKKRSPQMIIFWFFFSCISLIFWSTFSHLSFLGDCGCPIFFWMLLTFFLEMFYKKHNIFFVGRGKKGSLDFLKNSSIFKKREKTQKLREKKPKGKFSHTHIQF